MPVWDLGPVDFWAFALLASNFETLVFIAFFHLQLELLDLQVQLFVQLWRKLGRVVRLHEQTYVLELPIDQLIEGIDLRERVSGRLRPRGRRCCGPFRSSA